MASNTIKSIRSILQSLLGLWTIVLQGLFCFPSKTSKADLPSLLPTFDLVVPSNPLPSCHDVVISANDNSPSNSSWQNDKAHFIRSPSLKRASVSRKPVQRNSKSKARHLSKGYGGVPKTIYPAISTLDPEPGTDEWTALGFRVSESSGTVGPSKDLSPVSTTSTGLDSIMTRIAQSAHPNSSEECKKNDPQLSGNPPVSPALPFPSHCYPSNHLSAISGCLYDAAPNVVLRSIPVPQLAKGVNTHANKRETLLEPVPYPELFDFSLYNNNNNRFSRRSDLLASPQLNIYQETNVSSNLSDILPSSPDSCEPTSPAFLTFGLGISTPPSRVKKRFGVCTTPKASFYFGTASILNPSAVLPPKSAPVAAPIIDKNPRLSTLPVIDPVHPQRKCEVASGEELSSLECTAEELLNIFTL